MNIWKFWHFPQPKDASWETDNEKIWRSVECGGDNFSARLVEVMSLMDPPACISNSIYDIVFNAVGTWSNWPFVVGVLIIGRIFGFPGEYSAILADCIYLKRCISAMCTRKQEPRHLPTYHLPKNRQPTQHLDDRRKFSVGNPPRDSVWIDGQSYLEK